MDRAIENIGNKKENRRKITKNLCYTKEIKIMKKKAHEE
jgi:hypothetical protein